MDSDEELVHDSGISTSMVTESDSSGLVVSMDSSGLQVPLRPSEVSSRGSSIGGGARGNERLETSSFSNAVNVPSDGEIILPTRQRASERTRASKDMSKKRDSTRSKLKDLWKVSSGVGKVQKH